MNIYEDTICAPATSTGGAVAMIRVSGPNALEFVDKVVRFRRGTACGSRGYSLKFGSIVGLDDVVVAVYRSPNSYTGEDSAELSCHASSFIVSSILERLLGAGCRMAEAGEFTRRAFVNGKMDLAQAEAVADVISSTSLVQHRVAFNQLKGGYSAELAGIRGQLLELASLLELELDFSEEELEFADRGRLDKLLDAAALRCRSLSDSFRLGNAIRNGVPVAIVGSPNSGKSTLLNLLLNDDRAIVSDVPGTTRDTVEETCVIGGVLFRFIDTAGIRESSDVVEKLGIERSFVKASSADIVLGVVDASLGFESLCSSIRELLDLGISGKMVVVVNKVDLGFGPGSGVDAGVGFSVGLGVDVGSDVDVVSDADAGSGVSVGVVSDAGCHSEGVGATAAVSSFDSSDLRFEGGLESLNNFVLSINEFVKTIDNKGIVSDVVAISAKTGFGLSELNSMLVSLVGKVDEDTILVTNARHAEALRNAANSLEVVRQGLGIGAAGAGIVDDFRGGTAGVGIVDDFRGGTAGVVNGFRVGVTGKSAFLIPADLLAEDLREAIRILGTITGEITTDEVLGNIFKNFCIGK